jgi:hypothetical protein
MTWLNIVLALILFVCIIYVLVLAIDLRRTLKRAEWIGDVMRDDVYPETVKLINLSSDLNRNVRNLEKLNIECNATLIRAKELANEDIFDSTEDNLK